MSKIKEWFMDEKEKRMENEVQDNYIEHSLHTEFDKDCSTCYSENRLIDAHKTVNKLPSTVRQDSALSKLRASIQAQQEIRNAESQLAPENFLTPKKLELLSVPEITIESATEFNTERYEQLCAKTDVLFHNYLFAKENLVFSDDNSIMAFKGAIKLLTECIELTLSESVKIRWQ